MTSDLLPVRRDVLRVAAATAGVAAMRPSRTLAQGPDKAAYVLIHPAWHGAWCWKKVTPRLRAQGHEVHTPTLTGLGERAHLSRPDVGLATHIDDVLGDIENADLRRVILVGHSSSGMVITGVAERVPERIARLIYLDAFVPASGQSLFDLLPPDRRAALEAFAKAEGEGWFLPRFAPLPWEDIVRNFWGVKDDADVRWMLARLVATPLGHFTQAVQRTNPAAARLLTTYMRCLHFKNLAFDRHAAAARTTPNWRYRELATSHHPAVTHPEQLAELLLEPA